MQQEVTYLGHTVSAAGKAILPARRVAIQQAPKPETKQQMMSFLGLCNFCRLWIPNYAAVAQPLQDLICGKNMGLKDKFEWTEEANTAFKQLKLLLQTDTVLALPDCEQPFTLQVDARDGFVTAVLTQPFGNAQRPLAFYSTQLDSVARGLPSCVQACAAAAKAVNLCADIVSLHPLTVAVPHAVAAVFLQAHFRISHLPDVAL